MQIHFIAIGGSAMHNLALALQHKGYKITGSDDVIFEPSKSRLATKGLLPENFGWFLEKIHQEFPALKSKYWGRHFWAIGYGCWSTGNITDEMVNEYLEHHRKPSDSENTDFILEK